MFLQSLLDDLHIRGTPDHSGPADVCGQDSREPAIPLLSKLPYSYCTEAVNIYRTLPHPDLEQAQAVSEQPGWRMSLLGWESADMALINAAWRISADVPHASHSPRSCYQQLLKHLQAQPAQKKGMSESFAQLLTIVLLIDWVYCVHLLRMGFVHMSQLFKIPVMCVQHHLHVKRGT